MPNINSSLQYGVRIRYVEELASWYSYPAIHMPHTGHAVIPAWWCRFSYGIAGVSQELRTTWRLSYWSLPRGAAPGTNFPRCSDDWDYISINWLTNHTVIYFHHHVQTVSISYRC